MRRKRNYTDFGIYVIKMLIELNMTQRELCEKIGIPRASMCELLTGKQNNHERIQMISRYLEETQKEEGGEDCAI